MSGAAKSGDAPTPLRELAVASAGSGKTFELSSRLLGLLAAGVPPEQILASTFTRKAAGEILERVLERLSEGAMSDEAAGRLARQLPDWPGRDTLGTVEGCRALLVSLAGRLHRLQVYTLDAFFHRAVRAFALELGMPGRWSVADEAASERLRVRAVERVFEELGPDAMAGILRGIGRGRVQASVHRGLMDELSSLHADYRSLAPGTEDPWGLPGGTGRFRPGTPEDWEQLARAVAGTDLPRNKGNGKVPAHWFGSVQQIIEGLGGMDGRAILGAGLVKKRLADEASYSGKPISDQVAEVLDRVVKRVQDRELHLLDLSARAMGRFIERYHHEILRLRREEGVYEFGDLAFSLIEGGAMADPLALYYRLDGEVRHLLLDEFQDTSVVQWRALEPLAEEVLSGYEDERAVYLVGDPKQSIYGWRGGEPRILERVAERYPLARGSLAKSWRSSPVILELVNRVFGGLPDNEAFEHDEEGEAVAEWMTGFERHHAQFTARPGRWTVEVGPAESDGEDAEAGDGEGGTAEGMDGGMDGGAEGAPESRTAALLRRAAERVAELHRTLPGASIGVLTRRRDEGARILAHLKARGIEASGEGGVPLTDSPPVLAVLALLQMIDHPGDMPSRYLVGHTPLADEVGLGDWASHEEARRVASTQRARLLAKGYGPVVGGWVRRLLPAEGDRDRVRLRQLTELAATWEERATLRTMDFVRAARRERRELPGGAAIRIMTIHASKGLQFDVVVLPETGGSWRRGRPGFLLAQRSDPTGPVERIVPAVPDALASRVPKVEEVVRRAKVASLRDDLSGLYVAITRTRYALHVLVPPDGKNVSRGLSGARVLRCALGAPDARAEPGALWAERGDPEWWTGSQDASEDARLQGLRAASTPVPERGLPHVQLARSPRRRLLERRSPSSLEGGERVPLARVLRRPARGALDRGSLVHRWLEELEWLPAGGVGALDREPLLEIARRESPHFERAEAVLEELMEWLEHPDVARLLDRSAWPEGTTVRRELPFILRRGDGILQGVADRVLRIPDPEGDRVVVIDWKTDRVGPHDDALLGERIEYYTPQIEAYREALARIEGVPPERVGGRLVFLAAGQSVEV